MNKQIVKAQEAIRQNDYEQAASIYERILKTASSHRGVAQIKMHYQLGDLYTNYLNKTDEAKKHFKIVVESSNDLFWTVKSLEKIGEISLNQDKNFIEAEKAYLKLTSFRPSLSNQDFYEVQLINSLIGQNKYSEANSRLKIILTDPGNRYYARAKFLLGKSFFLQTRWEESIEQFKDYLKLEDAEEFVVEAKFLMANAYETIGDLKKAYSIYYNIADVYPNRILIKNRLQSIYLRRVSRKR